MAHLGLAEQETLSRPRPPFGRPKPAASSCPIDDYCSEPSTSGCSAAVQLKLKVVRADSDSDDSDPYAGPPTRRGVVFNELVETRRRYLEYEKLCKDRQMVIAFVNLTLDEEEMVVQLSRLLKISFNVCLKQNWDDTVTHLIVNTVGNGICKHRSIMYMHALLSNCYIVSTEWVKECLNTGYLVPELDYMVNDKFGASTPLISWWAGRGVMKSPMEWTETCILFFYDFDLSDKCHANIISWTKKAGFVIAKKITELKNENFRFRFIITDLPGNKPPPSKTMMLVWLHKFKAATVYVKWLLKCLYNYKFIQVDKRFQVLGPDQEMIENQLNMVGYV